MRLFGDADKVAQHLEPFLRPQSVHKGLCGLQRDLEAYGLEIRAGERGVEVRGPETSQTLVAKLDGLREGERLLSSGKSVFTFRAGEILDLEQEFGVRFEGGLCLLTVLGFNFQKGCLDSWVEGDHARHRLPKRKRPSVAWLADRSRHRMKCRSPGPQGELAIGAQALGRHRLRWW